MIGRPNSELYLLKLPHQAPTLPDCWSWSSLQAWRRCPRQWWLLRAKYANVGGAYPQPLSVGAAEGILVHHVIELFVQHTKRSIAAGITAQELIRATFPARQIIREK